MSFIVSFKTDKFVFMAADKRLTYVADGSYKDNSLKVHKINNFIYGLSGSGELGTFFEQYMKCRNFVDFIEYAEDFFNKFRFNQSKVKGKMEK